MIKGTQQPSGSGRWGEDTGTAVNIGERRALRPPPPLVQNGYKPRTVAGSTGVYSKFVTEHMA